MRLLKPLALFTLLTISLTLALPATRARVAALWARPGAAGAPNAAQDPPGQRPRGPVQVVRFTLYDVGIHPRQVRVRAGLIALSIEDLSGGTSGLIVERENDSARERVGLVRRSEQHWRGREDIMLEPGTYTVTMSDRPDNQAEIIVEP